MAEAIGNLTNQIAEYSIYLKHFRFSVTPRYTIEMELLRDQDA